MKQINLIGPCNNLSYGYITQNIIKAFVQKGIQVNLNPIGPVEVDEEAGYGEFISEPKNLDNSCPTIIIWHHHQLSQFKKAPGSVRIGFPIFETNSFSPHEIDNLNSVDRLFVTCKWFKDILIKADIDKRIDCIPLGVDGSLFQNTGIEPIKTSGSPKVKFLHIGKWEIRKGHAELIKAFGEEFSQKDVSLTLVCNNPFLGEENIKWAEYAKKHIKPTQLNILHERLNSCKDISALIDQHDVYVAPSKAEGWNLPLNEALYKDKICIATNYSGHTAFCTPENCLLIEVKEEEPMFDGVWFTGAGSWAKVSVEDIRKQLRKAHDMVVGGFKLVNSAESVKNFIWANSVEKILEVL